MPNHAGREPAVADKISFRLVKERQWLQFPGGKPKAKDKKSVLKQACREAQEEGNGYILEADAVDYDSDVHVTATNSIGIPLEGDPEEYDGDVIYWFIHNAAIDLPRDVDRFEVVLARAGDADLCGLQEAPAGWAVGGRSAR